MSNVNAREPSYDKQQFYDYVYSCLIAVYLPVRKCYWFNVVSPPPWTFGCKLLYNVCSFGGLVVWRREVCYNDRFELRYDYFAAFQMHCDGNCKVFLKEKRIRTVCCLFTLPCKLKEIIFCEWRVTLDCTRRAGISLSFSSVVWYKVIKLKVVIEYSVRIA